MTKALILLSGGQDSSTCLYWAKKNFDEVIAIGFNYGQKHLLEQKQALKIATDAGVEFVTFDVEGLLGGSSLTDHTKDHNESHPQDTNLPASFTAGRNALFLTIAASWGFNRGIRNIVTGVCQTDYSGYLDCRRVFIDSMEQTLSYAMISKYPSPKLEDMGFQIHTPLMCLTKAETFKLAKELGTAYATKSKEGIKEVSVLDVIINDTLTDYNGDTTMNEWGMGINNNPATALRVKGYYEAKEQGWI